MSTYFDLLYSDVFTIILSYLDYTQIISFDYVINLYKNLNWTYILSIRYPFTYKELIKYLTYFLKKNPNIIFVN